jgi:hypothetical protein
MRYLGEVVWPTGSRSFLPDAGERRLIGFSLFDIYIYIYIADSDSGFDIQPVFGLLQKIWLYYRFRPNTSPLKY